MHDLVELLTDYAETKSPFCEEILMAPPPDGFKMHIIALHDERWDPQDHLNVFVDQMELLVVCDRVKYCAL